MVINKKIYARIAFRVGVSVKMLKITKLTNLSKKNLKIEKGLLSLSELDIWLFMHDFKKLSLKDSPSSEFIS